MLVATSLHFSSYLALHPNYRAVDVSRNSHQKHTISSTITDVNKFYHLIGSYSAIKFESDLSFLHLIKNIKHFYLKSVVGLNCLSPQIAASERTPITPITPNKS
jgi:hypothetical protein